ncbi:DNA polymerase theta [Ceratocystis platani]|uniref:DNA polymerase theta n=1 Tax=Ceratocystis fimbriata f. sp. platani TaxID=88771 RepID=A0A0F8B3E1_CERFI|nr:DNA polymerase theta [Ceratocystis platani]
MEMDDSHSNSRIKRQIFHTTSVDAARQTVATRNAQNIANQQHSLVLPAIGSKRSLTDAFEPGFNGNHLDKENFKKPHIFRSRSLPFQNAKKQPQLFPSEIATLYADDDEVDNAEPSEYSQRKLLAATPTDEIDSTLSLAYGVFGLPPTIVTRFRELGVKSIYPWQRNCLLAPDVLSGEKNLIYSAPTGGGKSLVAEVLMLRRIMQEPRAKAILVLPYVALDLARNPWQQRADADAVRVVGFHGGSKLKATWNDFEIAVCTIEKANSMINTAIQEGHVNNLKAVVLDEIHMIDDGHRGYLMELLTSKLLSIAQPIQIIGMSATISKIPLKVLEPRLSLIEELGGLSTGLDHVLAETIPYGVGFHHAGITTEERDLIANAYDKGVLKVCVATCSLAAGINLAEYRAISIRLVATFESIYDYLSKTLLYHYDESMDLASLTTKCIDQLQELKVVEYSDVKEEYTATQLGQAIVASSFNPEDGLFIHRELQRALKSFVMDGDLHVFYIFTPVSVSDVVVNWQIFMDEAEKLDKSGERVLQVVGIDMCHLMKLSRGAVLHEETAEEQEKARIMKRFYLAFQLRDLCNEVPVHIVARKYDMPRGMVQNLSQTSQGFAAGMVKFCDIMGWGALSAVLDHFMDRLKAGARSDLLELAKITFIKSRTARIFWDNGFKTVASIANAAPTELAEPNKIRAQDSPDDNRSKRLLAKAKIISDSANRLWQAEVEASRFEEGQE